MKKRTTISGEVGKFFSGVGKEISRQVVGGRSKRRGGKNKTIHIHYHFNKGRKK